MALSTVTPQTAAEAAEALATAAAESLTVRPVGAGTKLGWGGAAVPAADGVELRTRGLDRILAHNAGDLTAVLEAGVPLATAQAAFAREGQTLMLDPPLAGPGGAFGASVATVGGIFATGDSGPLRHRYGTPRDLLLGMTVALADGTVARSGGTVIKNVAGYDIGKLFCGAYGTLGVILSVSVRLHPLPAVRQTALGACDHAGVALTAIRALAASGLELESLDVAWRSGRGGVLARCAGPAAALRAERAAALMRDTGLAEVTVTGDDEPLWARQRVGQRSATGVLVRVAAPPSVLPVVIAVCDRAGGTLVGRAGAGISYLELSPGELAGPLGELRASGTTAAVVLDAPPATRATTDLWGPADPGALALTRRVKQRFDPGGICNRGVYTV